MKLLLIRHAEPDYSIDSLTAKGRREAELLADRLCALQDIEGVYASPLGRAQATAAVTLRRIGLETETLPWLREFRGTVWDPVAGMQRISWDFYPRQWRAEPQLADPVHWLEAPILRDSNVPEIWQETAQGVDEMLSRHGYLREGPVYRCENNRRGHILCFCHFGIATAITAYLTGLPPIALMQTFEMAPSSVTCFVTEERIKGEVIWRCVYYGDQSHLYSGHEPFSTAGLYAEVYDGRDTTVPIEWEKKSET